MEDALYLAGAVLTGFGAVMILVWIARHAYSTARVKPPFLVFAGFILTIVGGTAMVASLFV